MYCITDEQIDYILNDIRRNGVETEDLQLNLLDHICCIIEQNLEATGDFERFYATAIKTFYKKELKEIEEETHLLLTFKNYYKMKKLMILSGALSAIAFIIGSFFKIMHWPGAGILLLMAFVVLMTIFLPLMFVLKTREVKANHDRLVLATGTLTGILYALSMLFKIMHWPGANMLFFGTLALGIFIFIPAYFFTGIRKPEAKVNTIVSTVMMVAVFGINFVMMDLRPVDPRSEVYTYLQNEQLLKRMQQFNHVSANQDDQLATDIISTCTQLKALLLNQSIGTPDLPGKLETAYTDLYPNKLREGFGEHQQGYELIVALKEKVNAYNAQKANDSNLRIPTAHTIIDADLSGLGRYTNIFVLNNLTQIQMFLTSSSQKQLVSIK